MLACFFIQSYEESYTSLAKVNKATDRNDRKLPQRLTTLRHELQIRECSHANDSRMIDFLPDYQKV
jgi:hypothetical protein